MKNLGMIFVLMLFLAISLSLSGKDSVELTEITNPDGLYINNEYLYISQGTDIFQYSKNDFKLIKQFGKKGEGPGEFKGRVDYINILPENLLISSRDKISYFKKNGEFIKEVKSRSPRASGFISIKNNFVGNSILMKDKTLFLTINLYNSRLEKVNMLFKKKAGYQRGGKIKIFYSSFDFQAKLNKVFIVGSNDFVIDLFNSKGDKLPPIKFDYKKIKVQDEHIKQVYRYFKSNPETKAQFQQIKKKLDFPSHFPAIRSIQIDNKYIYIQTYNKVKEKTEFYISDMKGNLKKRIFIPIKDANVLESFPFIIMNKTVFQLIENEETENWNMQITHL